MVDIVTDGSHPAAPIPLIKPELFRMLSLLLPPDRVVGVRAITLALTGRDDPAAIRAMFHLLENSNTYPARKIGSRWAVSPAAVQAKNWAQEQRAFGDEVQKTFGLLFLLLKGCLPLYAEAACGTCNPQQLAQLTLASSEAAELIQKLLGDQGDITAKSAGKPPRPRMIA